jgi:RHS repeat-associated protein
VISVLASAAKCRTGSGSASTCSRSCTTRFSRVSALNKRSLNRSYGYDTLDRLTSGPAGSGYTYGDSSHLDAVTSTGGGYSASYDAAGEMTCRAPTSSQTCSGTPTGQALTYDALGRLLTWSDGSGNSAVYGYDGSGNRVEQVATSGSTTTTTVYVGGDEEVSTSGSTTTTTTYYAAGPVTAISVNGTLSYLVSDTLGSTTVALSASGSVQADQLFTPYGATRYASGTMPTSYGFTGQRLDPSGLQYFNARYYDRVIGQFTSADRVQGPNRYEYVGGNPETDTDPTGNFCLGPSPDGFCLDIPGAIAGFIIGVGKTNTSRETVRVTKALEVNRATVARAISRLADAIPGSHQFNKWLGIGQDASRAQEDNGARLASLADDAEGFDNAGKVAIGIGAAVDFGVTAFDYYQKDTTDPTGLRVEKSIIAGTLHSAITTGIVVGVDAAIDVPLDTLTGGLATPLAAAIDVGIDTFVGGAAGGFADWVVNDTPTVNAVTDAVNTVATDVSDLNTGVSNAASNLTSSIGNLFSGW